MYRIPKDLDLRPAVGSSTTQVCVGQFNLQFTFGPVNFVIESPVRLYRGTKCVARWKQGHWPDAGFYDIMNVKVIRCEVVDDRRIVVEFESGLEMLLEDSSDQYESMQISFDGNPSRWII